MGLTDLFGLLLSTVSAEAVASYVAGVDLLLSANVGAEVQLERAVAADPSFALAHIARARMLQLRARMPESKGAVTRARALCEGVTPRERQQHRRDRARGSTGLRSRRWRRFARMPRNIRETGSPILGSR